MVANEKSPFKPCSPYAVGIVAAFWQVAYYLEAYQLFACSGILFNHESMFRPSRFVTQKLITAVHQFNQDKQTYLNLGDLLIKSDCGCIHGLIETMLLMLQQDNPDVFAIFTVRTRTLQ